MLCLVSTTFPPEYLHENVEVTEEQEMCAQLSGLKVLTDVWLIVSQPQKADFFMKVEGRLMDD